MPSLSTLIEFRRDLNILLLLCDAAGEAPPEGLLFRHRKVESARLESAVQDLVPDMPFAEVWPAAMRYLSDAIAPSDGVVSPLVDHSLARRLVDEGDSALGEVASHLRRGAILAQSSLSVEDITDRFGSMYLGSRWPLVRAAAVRWWEAPGGPRRRFERSSRRSSLDLAIAEAAEDSMSCSSTDRRLAFYLIESDYPVNSRVGDSLVIVSTAQLMNTESFRHWALENL